MSRLVLHLLNEQGVEIIIRSSLLIMAAFAAALALRRASASVRYWIWVFTFCGLLALPVMVAAGPLLTVVTPARNVVPAPAAAPAEVNSGSFSASNTPLTVPDSSAETNRVSSPAPQSPVMQPVTAAGTLDTATDPAARRAAADAMPDLEALPGAAWIIGVVVILAYSAAQWAKLAHAMRTVSNECDVWNPLFTDLVRALRLRRPVRLIFANTITVPMAWGTLRPAVLLPLAAKTWDADRRQIVLTHELIHIKRFDTLINGLALLMYALYWFNPLVWLAFRRLTTECEQSCDDLILSGGTRGSDYATHLVAVAYTALRQRRLLPGVTPMAHQSTLSIRVQRILDGRLSRGPLSQRTRSALVVVTSLTILSLGGLHFAPMFARNGETVITLAVPDFLESDVETLLDRFHTQYPDISVVIEPMDFASLNFGDPIDNPAEYYQNARAYATTADVLLVNDTSLSPEVTRAGIFLDLQPLVAADPALNADQFYPAAWELFQWDNGFWALPFSVQTTLVIYDPAAFDAAELAYPNDNWAFDDFLRAASLLTRYNADQTIAVPGIEADALPLLAATSAALSDPGVWQSPEFVAQLEAWNALYAQLYSPDSGPRSAKFMAEVPLTVGSPRARLLPGVSYGPPSDNPPEYTAAMLPGGQSRVTGWGFAASAGTNAPEAAYTLIKFLSSDPTVLQFLPGDRPAQRALYTAPVYAPEVEVLIDQGLQNGITRADMLYQNYLTRAITPRGDEASLDLAARLAWAEQSAYEVMQRSAAERGAVTLYVPTPVPTAILQPGEVTVRFLYQTGSVIWPTREQWDTLIRDFVQQDAQVGQIEFDTYYTGQQSIWEVYDCAYIYEAYSLFGAGMGLEEPSTELLPLDPLMNADPSFDAADFVPGTLEQMRIGEQIYGYPLRVNPTVIWYDPAALDAAGVPLPEQGWTVNQFLDALRQLHTTPDVPVISGGSLEILNMLIAALGGVPLDNSSGAWVARFTDPVTLQAIRQALDLARDGVFEYVPQDGLGYIHTDQVPLMLGDLNATMDYVNDSTNPNNPFAGRRATTLPTGSQHSLVSYRMSGAYISRQSPVPEACYRFIRFLSQHPEVFGAMPAQRSQFNNPAVLELTQAYEQLDTQLQSAHFDQGSMDYEGALAALWLNTAYDLYVESGGNLETLLADAQTKTADYLACASQLTTPGDSASFDAQQRYRQQLQECAVIADPNRDF